jgi:hypothetical protein
MNTKLIGDVTQAKILADLVSLGYQVLLPWGDNARYDLVIERDGKFYRLQCKTGRLRRGGVTFNTASIDRDTKKRKHYDGEADYFAVYCPENDGRYFIPVEKVCRGVMILRTEPIRGRRAYKSNWAHEFFVLNLPR